MQIKELKLGSIIKEKKSGFEFLIADHEHYGLNEVTLVSNHVIKAGCFDGCEPTDKNTGNYENRAKYGNNNYRKSNLHQWLNSACLKWFKPQHENDCISDKHHLLYGEQPYDTHPGFLSLLDPEFSSKIVEVPITALQRVNKGQGELKVFKTKVYLPSRTEFGWGNESGFAEGKVFKLFMDSRQYLKVCPTRELMAIYGRSWNPGWDYGGRIKPAKLDEPQIYDPKYGWWYWYRTPHLTYDYLVRVQSTYGALSYTMAYNDIVGIRPVLNLRADTEVRLEDTKNLVYMID